MRIYIVKDKSNKFLYARGEMINMTDNKDIFSVLVIIYNCQLEKLLLTLQSIVEQTFKNVEIILADDGSKNNYFTEIKNFFKQRKFTEYKLISNKTNVGTVKNLISGLSHVSGRYVKFLSAGDALYSPHTIENTFNFMEQTQANGCFGLLQGYSKEITGKIKKINFNHPFDLEAYRKKDWKRIERNLILYSDNVCGAAICYKTEYAEEYMQKIVRDVVYEEDIFQVLATVEGKGLYFFDQYMIWYEVGTGVSTSTNSVFQEMLRQDVERFYRRLYEKYPEHKYIKKRHNLMKYYKIENLYIRTAFRIFENPHLIIYLIQSVLQRRKNIRMAAGTEKGFLECKDFWRKL